MLAHYNLRKYITGIILKLSLSHCPAKQDHLTPRLVSERATCLDFSVAKNGALTAYRWKGESMLQPENLIWV